MSDEEKSIEEIIAELESLENQAKDEEEKQAAPNTDEMPEELTLEEPGEHIFSEDPLSPPVEVKAEQSEYEDIFAEKPPEKPRIEIEIEEVSDEISLKEAIEKKPSDAVPSDEHVIGELSLQEHVEELSLDEPTDIHTKEDEDVIEFSQDNIDEEKREETHGSEISLETEDISLMELSSEGPREEPTVDISSDIVRDDKSFEIGSMEQDADTVTPKEPSFDDAFDGTGGDSSSEASQEGGAGFGGQTVELTSEEMHLEGQDGVQDGTVLQDMSDEKFHADLPSAVPFAMASGGEPPKEPHTDKTGDFPPDEPPTPPTKTKTPLQLSRVAVLLSLFLVSVILYGIFVWPKLYEHRWITSGDVKYQVKINRITKTQQYFDAGSWHRGSIPKKMTQIARHKIEPKPASGVEEVQTIVKEPIAPLSNQAGQTNGAAQTTLNEQMETQEKAQEKGSSEANTVTVEAKLVDIPATPSSKVPLQVQEKTSSPSDAGEVKEPEPQKVEQIVTAVPAKRESPQTQKYVNPVKTKQYVIQLSSMRLEEFADNLLGGLKKKGWSAYKDAVRGKDKDPWYRVFLGGFATRDAAVTFMKEKNIEKRYPGSYIRSAYLSAPAEEK